MGYPAYGWRAAAPDEEGSVPWYNGPHGWLYIARDEQEQAIIAAAQQMRKLGWSAERIARVLTQRGHTNRRRKAITAVSVRIMLRIAE